MEVMKLLVMHFPPVSYYIIHFAPRYSPKYTALKIFSLSVPPLMAKPEFSNSLQLQIKKHY
jgi:hypothetical protein